MSICADIDFASLDDVSLVLVFNYSLFFSLLV